VDKYARLLQSYFSLLLPTAQKLVQKPGHGSVKSGGAYCRWRADLTIHYSVRRGIALLYFSQQE
jgi:hypothetical protein